MLRRILDRLVERSIPPFTTDDENRRLAEEAAENGIRQTARLMGSIAGAILVIASAVVFYRFSPFQQIIRGPLEIVGVSNQPAVSGTPGVEEAKIRQALEDSEKKLDDANNELQKKLDELTKERDALQSKVGDLERQVTELTTKPQALAEADLPASRHASQPSKRVAADASPSLAIPHQNTYTCGDGRVLRNPYGCRQAHTPALEESATPRAIFQCGDGRTVRNPSLCTSGHESAPAG